MLDCSPIKRERELGLDRRVSKLYFLNESEKKKKKKGNS